MGGDEPRLPADVTASDGASHAELLDLHAHGGEVAKVGCAHLDGPETPQRLRDHEPFGGQTGERFAHGSRADLEVGRELGDADARARLQAAGQEIRAHALVGRSGETLAVRHRLQHTRCMTRCKIYFELTHRAWSARSMARVLAQGPDAAMTGSANRARCPFHRPRILP